MKGSQRGILSCPYNEWIVNPELSVEPGVGTFPLTQLLYRRVVDEFEESSLILPEPVLELLEPSQ
jgi:hypothetical protein